MELIDGGEDALERFTASIKTIRIENVYYIIYEENLEWGPCITNTEKIICVGLNYRKHADETKASYPEVPVLFNKFKNALTGHLSNVAVPRTTERLDHEVELGIIIGKKGKLIEKEEALDYVFGYCRSEEHTSE